MSDLPISVSSQNTTEEFQQISTVKQQCETQRLNLQKKHQTKDFLTFHANLPQDIDFSGKFELQNIISVFEVWFINIFFSLLRPCYKTMHYTCIGKTF